MDIGLCMCMRVEESSDYPIFKTKKDKTTTFHKYRRCSVHMILLSFGKNRKIGTGTLKAESRYFQIGADAILQTRCILISFLMCFRLYWLLQKYL